MSYGNPVLDFYLQIRKGRIDGHSAKIIIGENDTVGTTFETLWPEGGLMPWPTSAAQLTVSSSSTDDDAGGTGALTVLVEGLATDFSPLSETITLDGQTGVTTTESYYRVNDIKVLTAGSTGNNQGNLYVGTGTITAGKPATVYALIKPGCNMAHGGHYTVPKGSTCFLTHVLLSADAPATFCQFVRPPGGLFYASGSVLVNYSQEIDIRIADPLIAGTDYEIRAKTSSGTANTTVFSELLCADSRAG
jgi:hypothetical protein